MRIIIGIDKSIDVRAPLIKYYYLEYDNENKRKRKYCNTLMLIPPKIIHTLYCKEDQQIKNNMINYEFNKNIRLIHNFQKNMFSLSK